MGHDSESTRRTFLKGTAAAAVGTTAVAGCVDSGGTDGGADGDTPTDDSEPTATESGASESTETPSDDGPYEVTMEPVGTVTFESVPQTWESYFPGYADMGVALGQGDGLSAVGLKSRYHTGYYDELDGVSVDKEGVTQLYDSGIDKELYYDLGNDVHLTDPRWLTENQFFGLSESDVEAIMEQVGPFIGNTIFRRTDSWHDYRYYTMYEAFGKVAEVFQEKERYTAFKSLHDDVLTDVEANLPSADQRPNGLLCFAASDEPEKFSPYRLTDKGTNKKHFHDLGISDALAGTGVEGLSTDDRGQIDYETMLNVDPEALFVRGHEGKSRTEFEDTVLAFMESHNVASELTAVQNGDVYRGGPIYQGPIQNLFLTERFATLLFPDTYSGEMFDRDELASIITG